MIAVIRICGQPKRTQKEKETLNRLKLRKKFTCTIIDEKDKVKMGMVKAIEHCVAYGKISEEFLKEMEEKRKSKNNVFFLHPPRGGFKKSSKQLYPKGILGEHEDITKLLSRML